MNHPRLGLTKNLKADKLSVSFGKSRLGFTFRSPRQLHELRGPYYRRVLTRLECLHSQSGRYFAQPSPRYLRQALLSLSAGSALSSAGFEGFLHAQRMDRIRRLPPATTRAGTHSVSPLMFRMALRLESLPWSHRPQKLWAGLGRDFDEIWQSIPLYTRATSSLDRLVFDFLGELRMAQLRSLKNRDEIDEDWA